MTESIGQFTGWGSQLPATAATPPESSIEPEKSVQIVIWLLGGIGLALFLQRRWYRLSARPNRPEAFDALFGMASFAAALLAAAMFGMIVAAWVASRQTEAPVESPMSMRAAALLMLGGLAAQVLVLMPAMRRMSRTGRQDRLHRRFTERMPMSTAATIGLLSLLLWWPLALIAGRIAAIGIELIAGQMPEQIAHRTLQHMIEAPRDVWLLITIFTVTILVPVVEELLYRGVLQESLRRAGLGPWVAICITTTVFVVMHIAAVLPGSPHALASLAVLSIGFGWLYEKTGRLVAPMVLHAAFNGGNALLAVAIASGSG